jgi:hypothetical protein
MPRSVQRMRVVSAEVVGGVAEVRQRGQFGLIHGLHRWGDTRGDEPDWPISSER